MLIFLSYASLFVLAMLDNIRGPFYPDILIDLGIGPSMGSLIFAVPAGFAFLGSLRATGWLKHKTSVSLLMWACLGMALGYAFTAKASWFGGMLVGCAIYGVSYGALNVAQNLLVHEAASEKYRRQFYSGLHAMYGLSSLLAPLLATWFRGQEVSWRLAMLMLSASPLLLVAYAWAKPALRGSRHGSVTPSEPLKPEQWRWVYVFAVLLSVYLWGEISVSSRYVLWLRQARGYSPAAADALLSSFFVALLSGRLFFGLVRIPGLSNQGLLTVSALSAAITYLLGLFGSPWWVVLSGLCMAPFYPVLMDELAAKFTQQASQAMGFVIGAGSLSVVAMHLVVGGVNEHFGLSAALGICATLMALMALYLLVRTMPTRMSA